MQETDILCGIEDPRVLPLVVLVIVTHAARSDENESPG